MHEISGHAFFLRRSADACHVALLFAANAERFVQLRNGKQKWYWRAMRLSIARLHVSRFGPLPFGLTGSAMPLGGSKQQGNQEMICRQFTRRNRLYR